MVPIIIEEFEKTKILSLYGIISEQTSKKITIQGKQPSPNTDWDLVHGILGSIRLDDDLEQRVGDELKKGNYRVTNVAVSSKKVGNEIVTNASVDLVEPKNGELPHKIFTTRGSIGKSFVERHDKQVNGLVEKLQSKFGGKVTTFGPYIISVEGTPVKYKQSFFVVEENNQKPMNIRTN